MTGAVNANTNATVLNASTSLAANITAGTLATAGNITSAVTTINNNTDSRVSTASSSLASTIPTAVWAFSGTKALNDFGALTAAVWGVATSSLTSPGSIGLQLATNSSSQTASSTIASAVWSFATRNLSDSTLTSGGSLATIANLQSATSSINTNIANASTSLASSIAALPGTIWSYSARTLSSVGTLVSDIWNASTRTLTSLTLSSQSPWTMTTSDFGTITAGSNYLATVNTIYNGTLTDSANVPTVTIYDPSRNVIANNVAMSRVATGTYSYSYTTSGGAEAGTWESVFSATVESGKTLPGNDYWTVVTTPAQVIINSISDTSIPQVGANITITNEGLSGNEYQYEWCVVSNVNNTCGGGDDVFHATAAKYINSGEDFNTTLTADVPEVGNYYFKVIVYFGTDSSGASRTFTATPAPSGGTGGNSGGGGGGGGGGGSGNPPPPSSTGLRADLNRDGKVNSIDFSILLYFWKSRPPFSNKYVDINKDGKIDSIDFSILLYEWGKK